jgi:O-antigen/teichoic acid export membrane protein
MTWKNGSFLRFGGRKEKEGVHLGGDRNFARDGFSTVVFTVAKLLVGLLTGIIIARALGPDGRGALTAVLTAPQVLGWILGMGSGTAVTYFLSRDATAGGKLLSTWLLIMVPISIVGVMLGEALLPSLLSAQSEETLRLARLFVPTISIVLLSEVFLSMLLGDQDFFGFNVLSFVHPAGTALLYVLLWRTGYFSVVSAVAVQALMSAAVLAASAIRVFRRHGLERPDLALGRQSVWYALRSHGAVVGGVVNQRLDLLIIPAYLAASSVGYYALAINVSWLVVSISGSLATIVMPAAANLGGASGRQLVMRSLHATVLIGMVLGGGLFVTADLAIWIVYGPEFAESVLVLRILLPGAVLYAAATILLKGLCVENRPFTTTIAQSIGMMATVVGLLAFLRSGGILAAAVVSTVAYTLVFVAAVVLYRRAAKLPWKAFLPEASFFQAVLLRFLANRLAPTISETPGSGK